MRRLGVRVVLCGAAAMAAAAGGCQSSHTNKSKFELHGRTISVQSDPPGARVWHIAQPTGQRVDLGMTPVVNAPVMVLTRYKGSFTDMAAAQTTMSELGAARVRLEKPGYKPHELLISFPDPKQAAERTVTLEPTTTTTTTTTRPVAAAATRE